MEPNWTIIRFYISYGIMLFGGGIMTFTWNKTGTWKNTGMVIVGIGLLSIIFVFIT